jgi:hypothetical protein
VVQKCSALFALRYHMFDYSQPVDEKTQRATQRVLAHLTIGEAEQQKLIDHCARNIPRDRYVPPSAVQYGVPASLLQIQYQRAGKDPECLLVHKHALGQLCDICGLPRIYMSKLNELAAGSWRRLLLAHNLNFLFANQTFTNKLKKPAAFLHRIVGGELRAVLTQSYNRHLLSNAVLQPFLAACTEVGLQPAKATVSDMRVHLQTYLPIAFQPIPGEFVALGTCWGNSDFGQGKLKISHNILRLSGGGNLVMDDAFSRVHLGSVVTDTDMVLSDDVAVKELEAIAAATRSAVIEAMRPDRVEKILEAVKEAAVASIPWSQLKQQLSKALTKDDLTSIESMLEEKIEDLPPPGVGSDGQPLASKWWAAAALAQLAEKTVDPTKAMELRGVAGSFLNPGK